MNRQLRRGPAIQAVIGDRKTRAISAAAGSRAHATKPPNAVLSAVGYNRRLVLKWLRDLLRLILQAILPIFSRRSVGKIAS